jgi:hypothetical protein
MVKRGDAARAQQQPPENQPPPDDPLEAPIDPSQSSGQNEDPQQPELVGPESPFPPTSEGYPQGQATGTNDIPTAKPGRNGIVESPYVPGKPVDIQGFPPGATVRDPYVNKLFIVPAPSQAP